VLASSSETACAITPAVSNVTTSVSAPRCRQQARLDIDPHITNFCSVWIVISIFSGSQLPPTLRSSFGFRARFQTRFDPGVRPTLRILLKSRLKVFRGASKSSQELFKSDIDKQDKYLYEFGPFPVDPEEHLLFRGEEPVPLSQRLLRPS
jgi:hypothetical protein